MSALALAAVAYNMAGAVAATGISEATIKRAIAEGELIAHFVGEKGSKRVIRAADLDDWISSLPTERVLAT